MKRNISLVSYDSSDEETDKNDSHKLSLSSKRKLPKISPLLGAPSSPSNPALHQGRMRTTPHVEGQFAAFVYVTILLEENAPLRNLLANVVQHAKEIEPALVCGWLANSLDTGTNSLHISLTRPIYLRRHQREELKRAVKAAARTISPFIASFSTFATFENDERTRGFLSIEIGAGHSELRSLSKAVEPTLKLLRQSEFYAEPRFHASIAWALLEASKLGAALDGGVPEHVDKMAPTLRYIPSLEPSFLTEINAQFKDTLSSSKVGAFEVGSICVKIGKEVFRWPLG